MGSLKRGQAKVKMFYERQREGAGVAEEHIWVALSLILRLTVRGIERESQTGRQTVSSYQRHRNRPLTAFSSALPHSPDYTPAASDLCSQSAACHFVKLTHQSYSEVFSLLFGIPVGWFQLYYWVANYSTFTRAVTFNSKFEYAFKSGGKSCYSNVITCLYSKCKQQTSTTDHL